MLLIVLLTALIIHILLGRVIALLLTYANIQFNMVNSAEQTLLNDFDEANKLDKILIAHSLLEKLEEKASSSSGLKDELKAREEEIDRCKENYALVTKLLNDMRS